MKETLSVIERLNCYHRLGRYRFRTEPDTASFIREYVKPGDHCLDIGAHKGVVTHLLRQQVGDSGSIIAFEPQPELFTWLKRMMKSFRFDNVTLAPIALADESGERKLYRLSANRTGSLVDNEREDHESVSIDAISLDEYCQENEVNDVAFIKIDVDGFEHAVLSGARELLTEQRPVLLVEISEKNLEKVAGLLREFGYGASTFEFRGKRYPEKDNDLVGYRHENSKFRNYLFEPEETAAGKDG